MPLPPTRSEIAAAQRATSVEVAKDRWNHEVENAVRWAQNTDWEEVRGGVEDGASSLWARVFGETPGAQAGRAKVEAQAVGSGVAATARDAYDSAKARVLSVEEAAENKILEARLRTSREVSRAEDGAKDKAGEAKGALASAWENSKGIAKGITSRAKAVVGGAEDKVEIKADGLVTPPLTPVEKALHQRYERPESKVNKTVAEALQERYTPLSQRDNTVLRGL